MDSSTFLLFAYTSALIIVSPGAAAITISTLGASYGMRASCLGSLGIICANTTYFALAATGITSVIAASPGLFKILQICGILYLLWIGGRSFFSASAPLKIHAATGGTCSNWRAFLKGYLIEITNPKALVYMTAVLPPFLNLEKPLFLQIVIFASCVAVLDAIFYNLYGLLGHKIAQNNISERYINLLNKIIGCALILVALQLFTMSAPNPFMIAP